MPMLLSIKGVSAWYGDMQALTDVDLEMDSGEAMAVVGANGAGKSTLLKLLCGLVPKWSGTLEINGHPLTGSNPRRSSALGIALVPEGRLLFPSLSAEENLMIGRTDRPGPWSLDAIYDLFPVLAERRHQRPDTLSGGQQQMVAIGRALASNPKLLLCDEISLGLSPMVTSEVYQALEKIMHQGVTLLIVDQDIARVCSRVETMTCLLKGKISLQGPAHGVTANTIKHAYFGVPE